MVMIALKKPVQVRFDDKTFVTFNEGRMVNYRSYNRDDLRVHCFSGWDKKSGQILEYKTVCPKNIPPEWL